MLMQSIYERHWSFQQQYVQSTWQDAAAKELRSIRLKRFIINMLNGIEFWRSGCAYEVWCFAYLMTKQAIVPHIFVYFISCVFSHLHFISHSWKSMCFKFLCRKVFFGGNGRALCTNFWVACRMGFSKPR